MTPAFPASRRLRESISSVSAGRTPSSSAQTAAICRAVGNVSFEDCERLTSSFGCSSRLPASSLPRFAMTSFAFMFVCVPEPVCQTTSGKWSASFPEIISSAAAQMAPHFSAVMAVGHRRAFVMAAAFFRMPNAWMISVGMGSRPCPIGKFSKLRWVCAPQ